MDQDFTEELNDEYRRLSYRVGLIVIIVLTIVAFLVVKTTRFKSWLNSRQHIEILMPEGGLNGLDRGAVVEILGTEAGKVIDVQVLPTTYVVVEIDEQFVGVVREDSQVFIRKQFAIAGESFLEITRGNGKLLPVGEHRLQAEASRETARTVEELAQEIRVSMKPVFEQAQSSLENLNVLTTDLRNKQDDILAVVDNFKEITGAIRGGKTVVGRLAVDEQFGASLVTISDEAEVITKNISVISKNFIDNMDEINAILSASKVSIEKVSQLLNESDLEPKDVNKIIDGLQSNLANIAVLLKDIKPLTESLKKASEDFPEITKNVAKTSQNLPVLSNDLEDLIHDLEALIRSIRSSWLIREKIDHLPDHDGEIKGGLE
ncbi:MAG: MlaD family protein [Lentisphaeria bacterium]|nr:MlaD family protein [Lentisphaeria bacterium]